MSVYLDNQAAKPVDDRVIAEMMPYFNEKFANPASLHCDGDIATLGWPRSAMVMPVKFPD